MKVVKRADLLTMPEGTIYSPTGEYGIFEGLMRKNRNVADVDWYYSCLVEFAHTGERIDEWRKAIASTPATLNYDPLATEWRNGDYDEDALYLVFEPKDLHKLAEILTYQAGPKTSAPEFPKATPKELRS